MCYFPGGRRAYHHTGTGRSVEAPADRPGLPYLESPAMWLCPLTKINELMAEKRQNARAEVEKSETPETPEAAAPGETPQPANTEEPKKPRRGRPPAEKAATENQKSEKIGWGSQRAAHPKGDKAAPDKPNRQTRQSVPKRWKGPGCQKAHYFIRKEECPCSSIGIDVSKGKSTVCGMNQRRDRVRSVLKFSTQGKECRSSYRCCAQR